MNAAFIVLLMMLHTTFGTGADNVWPLRFGVDDAGGPYPLYEHPKAAALFREFGFNLWIMHFLPPAGRSGTTEQQLASLIERGVNIESTAAGKSPDLVATAHYISAVDAWCREQGINWIANLESANWIASYIDGMGRDWYAQPDGRHFFKFPEDLLEELTKAKQLLGVMFDEAEHMQSTCDPVLANKLGIAGLGKHFMYDPSGDSLLDASARFTESAESEGLRYRNRNIRLFTEHVFPVFFHCFARAGYTAAPKILKESWSPLVIACAMGAAIQYNTELWITPDLWGMEGYPSHSPDAYRSAMLLAYHLGADCIYTENLSFDFENKGYGSLVHFSEDDYRVTPHGEVTKEFIHEYVPAHPRPYSFREVRPRVAIIRQPDGCWGQRASWLPDTLFGHPEWHSTPVTEAWFGIWHLLTHGVIPPEGLTWHCDAMKGKAQRVFAPLDGVIVFDHLVSKKHLEGVEALFLTGIGISEDTLAAVEECVRNGASCFVLASLAPERVRIAAGDNGVLSDGRGKWFVTTDFLAPHIREGVAPFLSGNDTIHYRFGTEEVFFHMIENDPNRIEALVRPTD